MSTDIRLAAATVTLLQNVGHTLEALEQSDALTELAHALAAVAGTPTQRPKGDFRAAQRTRDYLHVNSAHVVTLEELEAVIGRHRWSLSHDFRTFYGTSPVRWQ